jgi:hypothetical protein
MKTRAWFAVVVIASTAVACGDDSEDTRSSGGGGHSASGGSAGTGTGGGSGGAGGSGGTTLACGEGIATSALSGGSWDDRFTIAGFSGPDGIAPIVYDFATDTDGTLVATGRFAYFEGEHVAPLMRWKNGAWEPARSEWQLTPPGDGFSAIAIAPDGDLALATADSFGEKDGEIWIDDGTGLVSVGAYSGLVRSLAFYAGRLWVAGVFTIADTSISGLATWDGTSWSAAPGGALAGNAFELTVDPSGLWLGGAFTSVGGVAALNVAHYDGTTWTAYDFAGALAIYALARTTSGELYAGGAYGELFDQASGVAKWDGAAWQTVGGGLAQFQTRGVVSDLVAHGDTIDATGCFSSAGGLEGAAGAVPARSVARWNGVSWQSLDDGTKKTIAPWFQPLVCGDEGPEAIWDASYQRLAFDADSRLVAGGSFAGIAGTLSQAIISHDAASWQAQGQSGIGFGGNLDRIATGGSSCDVYGVGSFGHAAGSPALGRVVHFDGNGWKVLVDSLPSDAWCPALDVSPNGEVAVGCMAFPPTGDAEGVVLVRSGDEMVPLDAPDLGPVLALEYSPTGTLFVVGGGSGGYLAKIDGAGLTVLEDGFDSGVSQIDVTSDSDIVVAGAFTKVGDTEASRIARFDGGEWSSLGDGLPGQVLALERDGTTTYASSYDEGNGAFLLGAFNGESWQELATPVAGLTPESFFSFNRIRVIDGALILAGTAELDDGSGRGLLIWENGAFRALGGGVGGISVDSIAVTNDSIWVAGQVAQAGSGTSAVSSVGVARYLFAGLD